MPGFNERSLSFYGILMFTVAVVAPVLGAWGNQDEDHQKLALISDSFHFMGYSDVSQWRLCPTSRCFVAKSVAEISQMVPFMNGTEATS